MAAFPTVKYSWRDLEEAPQTVVERVEMERGMPKQRRTNSDILVRMPLTVYFDTKAEAAAFWAWFKDDINAGADYFTIAHPRTGATVTARVVGGQLGPLTFEQRTLEASYRTLQIEWLEPAW